MAKLFAFSKVFELLDHVLDTAFLVARKRLVIFLHWYHHAIVLLYAYNCYVNLAPQSLFCIGIKQPTTSACPSLDDSVVLTPV